jgi:hypothetical protein
MNYLIKLIDSQKTVFNTKDLAIIWGITDQQQLKNQIYYWTQNQKLIRLHQGIFALNDRYSRLELAGKLCYPSYISLETVLVQHGMIFQDVQAITSISNRTRFLTCDNQRYSYHKLKDQVLLNRQGIIEEDNYAVADLERAFLDLIYLYGDYHFDNLGPINWEKAKLLSTIYQNKNLSNRLLTYEQDYVGRKVA